MKTQGNEQRYRCPNGHTHIYSADTVATGKAPPDKCFSCGEPMQAIGPASLEEYLSDQRAHCERTGVPAEKLDGLMLTLKLHRLLWLNPGLTLTAEACGMTQAEFRLAAAGVEAIGSTTRPVAIHHEGEEIASIVAG